jgi:preprotein translocase subunit Sss1
MLQSNAFRAGIISVLCFIYAFIVSQILDKAAGPLRPEYTKARIFTEALLQIGVAGMLIYVSSYYVKFIMGYEAEIPVMVFIFFFFQKNFQAKVNYLIGHF